MAADRSIGVVIVNYNGHRFMNDCLRALLGGTYRALRVVVVDNASRDDSIAALRAEFPSVTVLPQDANLGVAAGNNIGARYCLERGDEFVLFLNYDTVPDPEMVAELVRAAAPDAVVSGNTFFWDDGSRSNSHAGGFNWALGRLSEHYLGRSAEEIGPAVREVDIADTCCLLVPRAAFQTAGFVNEAYFMYYDDTDFVVRLRAAGFRCLFAPRARLRHFERGASGPVEHSPISAYFSTRNRVYFMRAHAPSRAHYCAFLCYFAATRSVAIVRWFLLGRWPLVYWTLQGLKDFTQGNMGAGAVLTAPRKPVPATTLR
jgi:GT2 family glycosyltransferase